MKKTLKILFSAGIGLSTITSICSCNSNKEITITINSGLGFFMENYDNIGNFLAEPRFVQKKIIVKSGTSLADLHFKLPAMSIDTESSDDYKFPICWTVNDNEINFNYHFTSDTTITAQYFSSYSEGKAEMSCNFIDAVIGVAKRCVISGKDIPELLFDWPFEVYDGLTSLYTCRGFTQMLSFAVDTIGEFNKGIEYFNAMVNAAGEMNNKCGQMIVGTAYTGISGALKRRFMDSKPVTSWWIDYINKIADVIEECGNEKAAYFAYCMSALSDEIGETVKEEDPKQKDVNQFIFDSFVAAKDNETAFEMTMPTTVFIYNLKRAFTLGNDPTALIAEYKETINEILNR